MAIKISDSKITIDAVDVTQYVKNYNLYTGPDQPFPMVELELSQAKSVRNLIIPEEGKELHISASGVGTFIISSVELEEETYNIIGVHHSFRIKTIVTEEPYEGTPDEIFERIARDLGYSDIVISTKSYSSIKIYAGETIFNILNYIAELTASKWFFTENSAYLINWSNTPERPRNIPEPPATPEFAEPAEIPPDVTIPTPPETPEFNGNTWVVDASGSGDFLTINEAVNSASVVTGDIIDLRNDDNSGTMDNITKGLKIILNGHSINMLYFGALTSLISNGTIGTLFSQSYIFVYDCNIESLRVAYSGSHQIIFNSYIGTFSGSGKFASLYVYNSEIDTTGLYIEENPTVLFENVEIKQPFSFTHGIGGNIWLIRNYGADVNINLDTFDLYFIINKINITVEAGTVVYDTGDHEALKWVIDATGAGDFLTIQEAIESPAVISGDTIDLRNDDAGIPYELRFHGKKLKYLLNGYDVTTLYCATNSICENGTILSILGCVGFVFIYNCNINRLFRAWGGGGSGVFDSTINNFLDGTHRNTYCYNCVINGTYFSSTYNTDGIILFDNCEFTQDFNISSTHTTPRKIYFIECIGQNLTIDCPPDDVYLINNTFENVTYDANNVIRYEPPESYNILINYEPDPGLPIPSPPATPEFNGNTWVVDATGAGDFLTIQEAIDSPLVVTGDIIDLKNDNIGVIRSQTKGLKYLLNGYTIERMQDVYVYSVFENGTIDFLITSVKGYFYDCHIRESYLGYANGLCVFYNSTIDLYSGIARFNSNYYYNCLINASSLGLSRDTDNILLYDNCEFTQDFSISSTHTTPRPIWFINCRGRNLTINCPPDNIYLVNNLFENINIEAGNLIYRRDFGEPKGNTFPITQPETWVNLDDVINKVNVIYEMGTVTASDAESIAKYGESAKTYRNLSTFSTLAETITEEDAQRVADNILSKRKEPINCMAYNIKERTLEDGAKAWEQKYAYYSKAEIIDGFSNTHLIDVPLALIVHKYPQYIASVSWGRGSIPKLSEEIASLNNEIADRAISGGIAGELSNRPVALQVYGNQTLNEFDENTFTGFYLGKRFDSSGNPLYNWAGLNNGVEQVRMDTDGRLKAGENNLIIDENGLQIYIGPHNRNRIRLLDENGHSVLSLSGTKYSDETTARISSPDILRFFGFNKIELSSNYTTYIDSPLIQKTEWEYETEPHKTVFENIVYALDGVEETLTRFEITEDGISCEGNRIDASKCNTIRFRVGTTDPYNPKEGDAYIKRYPDNTFQLRVYDGSTWRYKNL